MIFEIILGLVIVAIIWVCVMIKYRNKSVSQDPVVPYKVEAPQQSAANTIVETPAKMKIPTLAPEVTVTEVTAAPVKAKKKASKKAVKKPKLNVAK